MRPSPFSAAIALTLIIAILITWLDCFESSVAVWDRAPTGERANALSLDPKPSNGIDGRRPPKAVEPTGLAEQSVPIRTRLIRCVQKGNSRPFVGFSARVQSLQPGSIEPDGCDRQTVSDHDSGALQLPMGRFELASADSPRCFVPFTVDITSATERIEFPCVGRIVVHTRGSQTAGAKSLADLHLITSIDRGEELVDRMSSVLQPELEQNLEAWLAAARREGTSVRLSDGVPLELPTAEDYHVAVWTPGPLFVSPGHPSWAITERRINAGRTTYSVSGRHDVSCPLSRALRLAPGSTQEVEARIFATHTVRLRLQESSQFEGGFVRLDYAAKSPNGHFTAHKIHKRTRWDESPPETVVFEGCVAGEYQLNGCLWMDHECVMISKTFTLSGGDVTLTRSDCSGPFSLSIAAKKSFLGKRRLWLKVAGDADADRNARLGCMAIANLGSRFVVRGVHAPRGTFEIRSMAPLWEDALEFRYDVRRASVVEYGEGN